jgi:P-type Ca2+ transporter type 2C
MAERHAIIRRLSAVETLGSASVLAVDKTGTLTENRMAFEAVAPPDGDFGPLDQLDPDRRERVERVAALCNDAALDPPVGDPTELALLDGVGAERVGALRSAWPRLAVVPFDAERKRMTTVHRAPEGSVELLAKGAPEALLPRCAWLLASSGQRLPMGTAEAKAIAARAAEAAGRGMRLLALARRPLDTVPSDPDAASVELELLALAGLRDPIRPAASASVAEARAAGITLLMATGDHPGTATAVAEEVGLAPPPVQVTTGQDVRANGLPADPTATPIYARVDPDQKLGLVAALQQEGHVVAMTGDGVNDAPALRRADIGIALGARGSDVAREAADMVVTDDDLATIVTAVREGRGVYDNIRKVVDYLVAGNIAEVLIVVCGLLFIPGLGVPLLPLQLLWINLLTDGMPALALGVDPVDPSLMRRPPRPRAARLLAWSRLRLLTGRGALIAAATLGALLAARGWLDAPWDRARAVMFTALVVAQLLYAFVVRRGSGGPLANRWLLLAVGAAFAAQLLIVVWPAAHQLFGTVALTAQEWLVVAVAGIVPALLLGLLSLLPSLTRPFPPRRDR